MRWLLNLFKRNRSNIQDCIHSDGITDVYKTIKYFIPYFKNIDPYDIKLYYTNIYIIHKSIINYIEAIQTFLIDEDINKLTNPIHRNEHNNVYLKEFIKNNNGELIANADDYINELLHKLYLLLEYKLNNKNESKRLYQYIIHVVNIYRELYNTIEEKDM